MSIKQQIQAYIASLPQSKQTDMQQLHSSILKLLPGCKLWFLDGRNSENKVISNPNIGYGSYNIQYANGEAKEFYQIGISANTSGISVYVMGLDDKTYLAQTYGKKIGKATVSSYCIKFKAVKDINTDVLTQAIIFGYNATKEK